MLVDEIVSSRQRSKLSTRGKVAILSVISKHIWIADSHGSNDPVKRLTNAGNPIRILRDHNVTRSNFSLSAADRGRGGI